MFNRFRLRRSNALISSINGKVKKNSRYFRRYGLEKEKITMIYENDIMVLVNISYDGFCLKVSSRVLDSISIGQSCYFKKFRLFDRQVPIYAQVVWISKKDSTVGFCIDQEKSGPDFHSLIEPVLLPLDIASSFKQIDIGTFDDITTKTLIYRGSYNSEIFIKFQSQNSLDPKVQTINSCSFPDYDIVEIKMLSANFYLSWTPEEGLSTGTFSYDTDDNSSTFVQSSTQPNEQNRSNVIYLKNKTPTTSPEVFRVPYLLSTSNIKLNKDSVLSKEHIEFFINVAENSYLKDKESILKIFRNYPCCGTSI